IILVVYSNHVLCSLQRLRILYTKILGILKNIPKDAAYRKYTEQIVNQRFNLVQTETDVQKLQDKLNSGHIEEVIVQVKSENELSCRDWDDCNKTKHNTF
uniref:NADH dehydrogenase [ubiquinone] 1 alpha subcomplex subunit 5 n=1 Tax=Athene cunicularia TaxID=194338 RepID=A0A663N6V6_ATHCN